MIFRHESYDGIISSGSEHIIEVLNELEIMNDSNPSFL